MSPVIPSKKDEDRDGRQLEFDQERYRRRNMLERRLGSQKECNYDFASFEKTAFNLSGMIEIAAIRWYSNPRAPRG